jgi:histidinol-phosphate phosphatase family protein
MEIKQAVILAGGRGERLKPFTDNNPKPMVPVNGKPFLEHLIGMLKENGIKEVLILLGYLPEKIKDYFGDGSKFGIKIKYSYTPFKNEAGEENESGLRIKNAEGLLDDFFLLLYCDNYWPLQLQKLEKFYQEHKTDVMVTVYANKDKSTKNNMLVDDNGYVERYDRSRQAENLNGVEIGFFIINKEVLRLLPEYNSHFERDILPRLISKNQVSGYLTDLKYYSIGDLERVKLAEKFLAPKKVVFLDRDGVINKKPPKADYVKNWSEFEFLPGAVQALKSLCKKGYDIYIITNQPGIARKMMSEKDLSSIHQKMEEELKKNNAKIKGIYCCIHGWDEGCECRKPKPGMLFRAAREHYLDLTKSIFIGDDERDIRAGEAAGCKTILIDDKINLLEISRQI